MVQNALQNVTEPIKLWEKIEIYVGEGAEAGRYLSRIEDFAGDGLVISAPEYAGGNTLMHNHSDCTVLLTRRDSVYEFHSRITVDGEGEKRRYVITLPGDVRRVQRRQFVRIEMVKPLSLALMPDQVTEEMSLANLDWHTTQSVDLSGGGLLMLAPTPIKVGTLLLVKIEFFGEVGLPLALGAICRRTHHSRGKLRAGIEFIRAEHLPRHFNDKQRRLLPESASYFDQVMQNKLANYIFQEQGRLRQKGSL